MQPGQSLLLKTEDCWFQVFGAKGGPADAMLADSASQMKKYDKESKDIQAEADSDDHAAEAAEEFDSALDSASESRYLLEDAIQANRLAGRTSRVKELQTRLASQAEPAAQ